MKNKLPKLLALFACIFLGGMLYGQSAEAPSQESPATTMPTFSTPEEKEKWISEHPAEYAQIQKAATEQNAPVQTTNEEPNTTVTEHVVPAGFPVYVNTGNKEQDDENYAIAKSKWIAEHPAEYEQMKNPKN